ncbi:MAG: flavodoxin family protein [Chloroflexi bacterium]|nr:flavodoxin family protein [Chloroflexota bacterium]
MNIGIIVFSQTGNTYSVAQRLEEKLVQAGHSANIERVEIEGELGSAAADFRIKTRPEVNAYDAIVFGTPVMAFGLSPVMKRYLPQISSLQGKKVACFITKQLPFYWTGGRQAVGKIKKICQSKNGTICGSGIVIWSSGSREEMIVDVVDGLSGLF